MNKKRVFFLLYIHVTSFKLSTPFHIYFSFRIRLDMYLMSLSVLIIKPNKGRSKKVLRDTSVSRKVRQNVELKKVKFL